MSERTLLLIGGPPGVGKSSVARELLARLDGAVWLDGDDLWRMNPFVVTPETIAVVEANVCAVLRNLCGGPWSTVLFTWVLHRADVLARLTKAMSDLPVRTVALSLVCTPETLAARFEHDPRRDSVTELALERLEQMRQLDTIQIDTTARSPQAVAEAIAQAADVSLGPVQRLSF